MCASSEAKPVTLEVDNIQCCNKEDSSSSSSSSSEIFDRGIVLSGRMNTVIKRLSTLWHDGAQVEVHVRQQ